MALTPFNGMFKAFIGALLLTVYTIAEDDVHFLCKYQNDIIDCSNSDLATHLKLDNLANTTRQVLFNNNDIKEIHVLEQSTSISNLSFRHNLIFKIESRAFMGLENLTYLDLSHNHLTTEALRPITFKGPDKPTNLGMLPLKVLDLSSNALHSLHQDLFEFLGDLEELYLASNPFRVLDHGTLTALSSIHKIRVLDLAGTQLKDIPTNWLNAAKNLEILNLSMNYLQTVPSSLEEARGLRHLILSDNLMETITFFPKLTSLQILEMNWMSKLSSIKAHSLVNLTSLKDLYVANNENLFQISEDALVEPGNDDDVKTEGAIFPHLEKLDLSNNKLQYLEEELYDRWDNIKVLKLDSNPWICDCKNQWMVSKLVPIMLETNNGAPKTLICGAPIEMKGTVMLDLKSRNYEMRCLDLYGNEPDGDAKVLIIVLVVVLIAIPVSLLFLHLVKRPQGQTGYPTAYYRRTRSFDSVNY